MQSSSSRTEEERARQLAIRKQISLLQAQLKDIPDDTQSKAPPSSPKRRQSGNALLAPATPSPKKRRIDLGTKSSKAASSIAGRDILGAAIPWSLTASGPSASLAHAGVMTSRLHPSNVLSKLSGLSKSSTQESFKTANRSSGFSERPQLDIQRTSVVPQNSTGEESTMEEPTKAPQRDDRLALVENLTIGPVDHRPPFDDPLFEGLEPNSGIRLSSRVLPHEDIQDYLRGRYYLSPSQLYASARLLPDKSGYDVPVDSDWVTIAVVAERGPIKLSRAPVGIGPEDEDAVDEDDVPQNGQQPAKSAGFRKKKVDKGKTVSKQHGKKYVNIKLIDFGARAKSSSSASGQKPIIRGDAFLSLLLFESDGFDTLTEDSGRVRKTYRGGSRGAFEAMSKLKEGDVIALLNPRILKPFQRTTDTPHPTDNIFAVTPQSADSIIIIGRASDLGMCQVIKRDGKICGGWCDKRVADVCEWHLQHAVERRKASRAEFSTGTTGLSSSSAPKRKLAYDPARQWGLKPVDSSGSGSRDTTYIVSGHIVNDSGPDARSLYTTENLGREGQAKAKRKFSKDADAALKSLLERDKEGTRAMVKAREVGLRMREGTKSSEKERKAKGDGKRPDESERFNEMQQNTEERTVIASSSRPQKRAYSTRIVQQLGFDPAVKRGQKRADGSALIQEKLNALAVIQSSRKVINLGSKPGPKIRSGVRVDDSSGHGMRTSTKNSENGDSTAQTKSNCTHLLHGDVPPINLTVDLDEGSS